MRQDAEAQPATAPTARASLRNASVKRTEYNRSKQQPEGFDKRTCIPGIRRIFVVVHSTIIIVSKHDIYVGLVTIIFNPGYFTIGLGESR
ncbi:uncharacterized protein LACBIDRAFT_295806 [Laccaria bicolor S238N-H82]|uniref:Predicted protein n=1 Tax=Laccaria bicolor (strain S238N-H82 / ATCC MYA-4686) TaxID=486041 RepID=B0DYM7_LACBS|nr:uncharacterized protein LACBIDRAFT_295806 [Laccaria bicolor S238N-H82]EDR00319.1 predicted protein [Laccaria bicolor S238N-H82]|eukprot:XP_001889071.1 predicted protein [Laccaria bicolor S238N-H82]